MGGAPADAPLDEVEAAVRAALAGGSEEGLRVLGYGEITLVVGWPGDEPSWACKRLPEFGGEAAARRYGEQFDRYLRILGERGVTVVPSEFRTLPGEDGRVVGYVVQGALPAGSLGPDVLRAAEPDPDHPVLQQVCERVPSVVDDRTGLDGQISNWAWVPGAGADGGDALGYLDVTTPMLFDEAGAFELDLGLFLAAYPWLLRAPIRRFVAPGVVQAYRDPRHVLVDLAANLLKERLEAWVPAALVAANAALGASSSPITDDEVRAYYRSDARLWEVMLRLRRADRWWQTVARRRPYPFLLPGPIAR